VTHIGQTQEESLESVADDIDAAASDQHSAATTVRSIAADRRRGMSWAQIADKGTLRHALDLLSRSVQLLRSSAARIRRRSARGLVDEGVSTRRVGALFGVSHQRISSIVAHRESDPPGT
jgi:hypothetical protein